jgi:hypothetical protein
MPYWLQERGFSPTKNKKPLPTNPQFVSMSGAKNRTVFILKKHLFPERNYHPDYRLHHLTLLHLLQFYFQ